MSIIIYASLPHCQIDGRDKECPPPTEAIGDAWTLAALLLKTLVYISVMVYKRCCRIIRNVSSLVTRPYSTPSCFSASTNVSSCCEILLCRLWANGNRQTSLWQIWTWTFTFNSVHPGTKISPYLLAGNLSLPVGQISIKYWIWELF